MLTKRNAKNIWAKDDEPPAAPPPPAFAESAFTLEIIRCTFDKEFSACVKQGRKIPAALASNNCSRTQALKYSTEVTRKEFPAAVKNDRSLPPFTQHINLQTSDVTRQDSITATSF